MSSPLWKKSVVVLVVVSAIAVATGLYRRDGDRTREIRRLEIMVEGLRAKQNRFDEQLRKSGLGLEKVVDLRSAPSIGSANAPVTLVEFGDYECAYCAKSLATMAALKRGDVESGRVRIVFISYPVPRPGSTSRRAHQFAYCAEQQGRFWTIHPKLFGPPGQTSDRKLAQAARDGGLDGIQLSACLAEKVSRETVEDHYNRGRAVSVNSTPYYFLGRTPAQGGERMEILETIRGAAPLAAFESAIERLVKSSQ